ncbi:MAG: YbhB/YbcL family Raf kinase inhibitor-like protein [Candidatus Thermoplasmatota archaeon]|nr:YbhB/YbcL family Raf kinase inhibitor-like protein [Candidatus Thermoplasmatota archaeon]
MTGIINISSSREGDQISIQNTCDGEDISPAISWSGFPPETKSYAIIMDDPDAPMGTFVHWVVYDIPSSITEMKENFPKVQVSEHGITQGKNDFGNFCYGGPCPPGQKPHRYIFHLYSTLSDPTLPAGMNKKKLLLSLEGRILEEKTFTLSYKRRR